MNPNSILGLVGLGPPGATPAEEYARLRRQRDVIVKATAAASVFLAGIAVGEVISKLITPEECRR
jgi:hypothetical protein